MGRGADGMERVSTLDARWLSKRVHRESNQSLLVNYQLEHPPILTDVVDFFKRQALIGLSVQPPERSHLILVSRFLCFQRHLCNHLICIARKPLKLLLIHFPDVEYCRN